MRFPMHADMFLPAVLVSLMLTAQPSVFGASGRDGLSWMTISSGVNYAVADSALGDDVFVGLSGWNVKQEWGNNWVSGLYAAKLRALGVRHVYSVAGPQHDNYSGREIGTLELARHLLFLMKSHPSSKRIIIAAHSSGSYVAHALFQDLYDGAGLDSTRLTDGKILYFCLDGGIGSGSFGVEITQRMADRLGHICGVSACVPAANLFSPNHDEMVELGGKFGLRSSSLLIDATGCGCNEKWCVHLTLINQKPYNQSTDNVQNDYGNFNADHPVATAYLDSLKGSALTSPQQHK